MDYSPLSKLSAELRNRVWEFVLVGPDAVDVLMDDIPHPERPPHLQCPQILAVTLTCRQVQHESLPIFLRSKIRIRAEKAIGSAYYNTPDLKFITEEIKIWYESWGIYVANLENVEICLGDMRDDNHDPAHPDRNDSHLATKYRLVEELRKTFKDAGIPIPRMTIELEIKSPSSFNVAIWPQQPKFAPIKIDLSGRRSLQANGDAITRTIAGANEHAERSRSAMAVSVPSYFLNYLQEKELRARTVLDTYSMGLLPMGSKF